MTIQQDIQGQPDSPFVELFEIDGTSLGGSVYRFTPSIPPGSSINWQGVSFVGVPIMAEGFEVSGTGAAPRPTLRVSNANKLLLQAILTLNGLVGARVTRWRTFEKYLDGKPSANPDAYLHPLDRYVIDQKSKHTRALLEFALAPATEQAGRQIPARQVLRDTCPLRERLLKNGVFDYNGATCPYTGGAVYDVNGNRVAGDNKAQEVFSKKLNSCCVPRFGAAAELPIGAFPGVARTRV